MNLEQITTILAFLLILGGLLAIIFPFAPSVPTVWFGIFLYAIGHDFISVNQNFMILVSTIAMSTIILDYALSRGGVQRLRAGPVGVLGAVVGGAVGGLFNPIMTYLVGPLVGAIVFETLHGRDRPFSYKTGNYTIVAFMGGTIIKLIASITMIGLFVLRLQGKI